MCKLCRRKRQNRYYDSNKNEINERRREKYYDNPEDYKAKRQEYVKNNPDKVKKWTKKYYHKHKEQIKERNRRYNDNNKEYILQRDREYYERNKTLRVKASREYRKNNPDVIRRQSQVRMARKKKTLSDLTVEQWIETLNYFDNACSYCGRDDVPLEQEHVIPLYLGGGYTKNNIIPACKSCNSSKDIRLLDDWFPKRSTYTEEKMNKIMEFIEEYTK